MESLTGATLGGIAPFTPIDIGFASAGSDSRQSGGRNRSGTRVDRDARENTDAAGLKLSPEKQEQVRELQARDREVRAHEQAHISASGGVSVSGPNYTYRKGPDGQMYAVGGAVQIDVSEGKTPEDTITRARQIRTAATAPAQPSGQDRAVAAQASQMEAEARKEINEQRDEDQSGRLSAQVRPLSRDDPGRAPQSGSGPATATAQALSPARTAEAYRAYADHSASPYGPYGLNAESGESGALRSGYLDRSGLYPPRDPDAQPSQQDRLRVSQAYRKAAPETGLAPAGSGIRRAV